MLDIEMRMSKYLSGVRSPNMKNILCMGVLIQCDDYKKKTTIYEKSSEFSSHVKICDVQKFSGFSKLMYEPSKRYLSFDYNYLYL